MVETYENLCLPCGVLMFHEAYELSAAVEMMVYVPFFLVYLGNYQREMLIYCQDSQIFLHPLPSGPNHEHCTPTCFAHRLFQNVGQTRPATYVHNHNRESRAVDSQVCG